MSGSLVTKRLDLALSAVEKFVAAGKRKVRGFASTDSVDRMGDVVVPGGGTWKLPLPMLWNHEHATPIGWIRSVEIRGNGLWIEAEFAEGIGKADEIWSMVDAGLVTGFSIGFRASNWENLPGGGRRFTDWELYEISAVVSPANPDAEIQRSTQPVRVSEPIDIPVIPVDGRNIRSVFEDAVARLPAEMAMRVDIFKSSMTPDGRHTFNDAKGQLIWKHPDPQPIVEAKTSYRRPPAPPAPTPAPKPAPVKQSKAPSDIERGTKIWEAIKELAEVVGERMDRIEDHLDEVEKRRGLAFKGEFQRALSYVEGDVVTRGERLYVAAKDVPAGGNLRDGMEGWVLMIKGAQQ